MSKKAGREDWEYFGEAVDRMTRDAQRNLYEATAKEGESFADWLAAFYRGPKTYRQKKKAQRAAAPRRRRRGPVILSYGMGVDSSALLVRWLLEPKSRDFELDDLVVVTAQTGDEFLETARQVNQHILPLLREAGVRFVQVARAGLHQTAGTRVLADSSRPERVELDGDYKLSDEMLTQGTVPQYASGKRLCSIHGKGWPLDAVITAILAGDRFDPGDVIPHTPEVSLRRFRHVIGFNAEELVRVERDQSYSGSKGWAGRESWYPLVEWGWGRESGEVYLQEIFGEQWLKSCCVYCPFTGAREAHIDRLKEYPDDATFALLMEHCSLAFNPNQAFYSQKPLTRKHLERLLSRPPEDLTPYEVTRLTNVPWGSRSLWDTLREASEDGLLDLFERELASVTWGLYHLRRVVGHGPSARSLELILGGLERDHALGMLAGLADQEQFEVRMDRGQGRIWFRARIGDVGFATGLDDAAVAGLRRLRTTEEFIVATPDFAESKQRQGFERRWEAASETDNTNRRDRGLDWVMP